MFRFTSLPVRLSCALCILVLASSVVTADNKGKASGGVLDHPLPIKDDSRNRRSSPGEPILRAGRPEQVLRELRGQLQAERDALVRLPHAKLKARAEKGERAAQVTLAEDYVKEAAMLAFAPLAANDALSDAVRWYSMAAMRGFPGAPSLDKAGVKFLPIRVQRSR